MTPSETLLSAAEGRCWVWTKALHMGYGSIQVTGSRKRVPAHRLGENLKVTTDGKRQCRTCMRARQRVRYWRARAVLGSGVNTQ